MSKNLKEPKKKPSKSTKTYILPLPISLKSNQDKNLESISVNLPGKYEAILDKKLVYVPNEWHAKALINCGCFGKGEYSRGEPVLNAVLSRLEVTDEKLHECSIRYSDLVPMSNNKFAYRSEWSKSKQTDQSTAESTFHENFIREFTASKLTTNNSKYAKLDYDDVMCPPGPFLSEETIRRSKKLSDEPTSFRFIIKKMPNVMLNERLILMYEEAFFLQFGLGCLRVNESMKQLSNLELWQKFFEFDENFPFKYAVYHSLRRKGWIIKNGLKYGCDFLAYYKGGPEYYHASYSIRVKHISLNDLTLNKNSLCSDELTQFSALVRISETVSKELMICYVVHDDNILLGSPNCLKSMRVLETIVNRWTVNQNRTDTDSLNVMQLSSS